MWCVSNSIISEAHKTHKITVSLLYTSVFKRALNQVTLALPQLQSLSLSLSLSLRKHFATSRPRKKELHVEQWQIILFRLSESDLVVCSHSWSLHERAAYLSMTKERPRIAMHHHQHKGRRWRSQPKALKPVCCFVFLLLFFMSLMHEGLCTQVAIQPMEGQGISPSTPVSVYVSSMLERVLNIDGKNYRFETLQYVYLSWRDNR